MNRISSLLTTMWRKKYGAGAALFVLFLGLSSTCHAYTVETAASPSLEKAFIALTTAYFTADLQANPLVSNTYTLKIQGLNPNFNPPPSNADLLKALVTVDSYTYVNGWADGETYGHYIDSNFANNFITICSSPTVFNLMQTSTSTFDKATCQDTLATFSEFIKEMHNSTVTTIPGDWQ